MPRGWATNLAILEIDSNLWSNQCLFVLQIFENFFEFFFWLQFFAMISLSRWLWVWCSGGDFDAVVGQSGARLFWRALASPKGLTVVGGRAPHSTFDPSSLRPSLVPGWRGVHHRPWCQSASRLHRTQRQIQFIRSISSTHHLTLS